LGKRVSGVILLLLEESNGKYKQDEELEGEYSFTSDNDDSYISSFSLILLFILLLFLAFFFFFLNKGLEIWSCFCLVSKEKISSFLFSLSCFPFLSSFSSSFSSSFLPFLSSLSSSFIFLPLISLELNSLSFSSLNSDVNNDKPE
jgi:hypothetical protein